MRVAAQVFLAYALMLVLGPLWHLLPLEHARPDIVGVSAVYLGLTARDRVGPATAGAAILGYLGDLLIGTPRGLLALTGGLMCILGFVIHRRLLVRGLFFTVVFTFFVAMSAGFLVIMLRVRFGMLPEGLGSALGILLPSALLTALLGPALLTLCRLVDSRFARTHRDRAAALEGLFR